jgi:hypothetical protein
MTGNPDHTPVHLARPPRENMLVNLVCNIVLPGLILSRLSSPDRLGPIGALLLGIAFPLGYGAYDLAVRKKWNFFSIVGLGSTALTGSFALMELDAFWFAIKEASIPTLFGIAILATAGTERPLVREFILNESMIDVPRLEEGLTERGTRAEFEALLRTSTLGMAASFTLSALLNFGLARVMLKSPPGTPDFTAELGHMTWMSWPVIALPSMVLTGLIIWRLMAGIHQLTGLGMDDLLHSARPETRDNSAP